MSDNKKRVILMIGAAAAFGLMLAVVVFTSEDHPRCMPGDPEISECGGTRR